MNDILKMTLAELSCELKKRSLSSVEITKEYIENTEKNDKNIGAYLTFCPEKALISAERADKNISSAIALSGIPYAVKDNICTKGIKTTCASVMLENFIPCYSSSVYEKLDNEFAVLLGKTNLDEFAMGSSTENSAFKITANPFDLKRTPGGSSGGSAAAVASFEAAFALGSDTGGSVRQPAAYCGLVGMMPTYGRVSRFGLIPFASSLDRIGPITRTVNDNKLVFDKIAFKDKNDPTSVCFEGQETPINKHSDLKGIKIGFDPEMLSGNLSDDVKNSVRNALSHFEKYGAEIVFVTLPSFNDALFAYYIISSSEAFSNLSRYDGIRYGFCPDKTFSDVPEMYSFIREKGFGDEVKRRMKLGSHSLSVGYFDEYYGKALAARRRLKKEFSDLFGKCDVFLSPVTPTTAPLLGEKHKTPEEIYLSDIFTVPESLAGLPSLSLPSGIDKNSLPVGMQITGPAFSEELLYRIGEFFETTSGISFASISKQIGKDAN